MLRALRGVSREGPRSGAVRHAGHRRQRACACSLAGPGGGHDPHRGAARGRAVQRAGHVVCRRGAPAGPGLLSPPGRDGRDAPEEALRPCAPVAWRCSAPKASPRRIGRASACSRICATWARRRPCRCRMAPTLWRSWRPPSIPSMPACSAMLRRTSRSSSSRSTGVPWRARASAHARPGPAQRREDGHRPCMSRLFRPGGLVRYTRGTACGTGRRRHVRAVDRRGVRDTTIVVLPGWSAARQAGTTSSSHAAQRGSLT